MKHKGYTAEIGCDKEDEVFHGRVANIADVIVFEGKSVEELKESFHAAVDEYLEDCKEIGATPCKPSSGCFISPCQQEAMHRWEVMHKARSEKKRSRLLKELEARYLNTS